MSLATASIHPPITTPIIALVGPTAIGKTALSLQIAELFQCEIISMDSMQVYRFMDIGTAKATREECQRIPHHLIDIVNPDEQYDAARFVEDAVQAITLIHGRGKIPLIVGGTGMYLSSLINGICGSIQVSPEIRMRLRQRLENEGREVLHQELLAVDRASGQRVHCNDTQRLLRGLEIFYSTDIPWSEHLRRQREDKACPRFPRALLLGLTTEREIVYERIKIRSSSMMSEAFASEIEGLLARGYASDLPSMQSIGYRHMLAYLAGTWDRETATTILIHDTRRYAKRQMTWFRNQQQVQWYHLDHAEEMFEAIASFIQ